MNSIYDMKGIRENLNIFTVKYILFYFSFTDNNSLFVDRVYYLRIE